MELQRVNSNRIHKTNDLQQTLKAGDITRGKIIKLYPNQKAAIQLGNQTIVAQLEAPLSAHESYYFQVQQSSSDMIHLKVLHDDTHLAAPDRSRSLLQFLNLKATKANVSVLDMLIQEKVPFNRTQLAGTFQIIDQAPDKGKALPVVKEMILRNLPLSDATFHALSAYKKSSFSGETREMLQMIGEKAASETNQSLQSMLEKLLLKPRNTQTLLTNEITSEMNQTKPPLYNLLKVFGILDETIDLSNWRSYWSEKSQVGSGKIKHASIPLPSGMKDITTVLANLKDTNQNKTQILSESKAILDNWKSSLHQALIHQGGVRTAEFTAFKNDIQSKLIPHLTNDQSQMINGMMSKNNASAMADILNVLQTLSKHQTYQQIEHFLGVVKTDEALYKLSPKDQFLQQLNAMFMTGAGVGRHDYQVDVTEQSQTMKSLLFQLLHTSDGALHDKASQLLHFINGMHLQSVQETAHFLEASIQIPVEKLGLSGDMELEISSHKNTTGEIDPDYCHIVFYLDLANLNKTMVDMQIQKRTVSLTIFNDQYSELQDVSNVLKHKLTGGLKKLDYDLQSVIFKDYQLKEEQEPPRRSHVNAPMRQGVDYRI